MRKIKRFAFSYLLCSIAFIAQAQQKYAVLVGINNYYDKPGVVHKPVLQGCVNDAKAIGSMLQNRFGFDENNMVLLSDDGASKKNVMTALYEMLGKCHAGDAFVFYFSGHGVWMANHGQDRMDAVIKNKMNQAMVMSDLYADNLDCLFTDGEVKKIFNKFIDKKVVPTTILDCCFSGKMDMSYGMDSHNPYEIEDVPQALTRSLDFEQIYTAYRDYREEQYPDQNEDSLNNILLDNFSKEEGITKSFNMKDAIVKSDPAKITRPSERTGSMFLSLAGTNDTQVGLEIADETGTRHGAFTAALLHVIKDNPSDLPVSDLIDKINHLMQYQLYEQTPMHFQDNGRLKKNLLGIAPKNFNNHIIAHCTGLKAQQVILDKGLLDNIAVGNFMKGNGPNSKGTLRITKADKNSAMAIITDASAVRAGDSFTLTDNYTISAPLVKVFISGADLSPAAFSKLVQTSIIPLTRLSNYSDYENWDKFPGSVNLFYNRPDPAAAKLAADYINKSKSPHSNFMAFLPVPAFITASLKTLLLKNQNVVIVNSSAAADLELCLQYIKPQTAKDKPHYIFTWTKLPEHIINNAGDLSFSRNHISTEDLNPEHLKLQQLTTNISGLLNNYIRTKTDQWMNTVPAK